jgi:diguanylate cyclase (GGDEF)-like protein/PAS domain S-box-containing protein
MASKSLHALILEDRPADAELVVHELRRAGFDPLWARVEDEAGYRAHLNAGVDLVLADYNLPQFDAFRALDILKGSGLDIPFILVSGTVGEEAAVSAMRAGASDYIFKDNLSRLGAAVGREVQAAAERKSAQLAKQRAEESVLRLASIVESSEDAIFALDLSGRILSWNAAAERMYGYTRQEAIGQDARRLLSPERAPDVDRGNFERVAMGHRLEPFESVRVRKDGGQIDVSVSISAVKDGSGGVTAVAVIARDITERKQAQESLEHQANHDALTGLPNRVLLQDRLQQAILAGRRSQTPVSLLMMDLDSFKEINDTFGHQAGDALLQQLGPRLRQHLRDSDTVARLGGDEFAIVLPGTDVRAALEVCRKIRQALEVPFTIERLPLQVSGSIGIAIYPQHGDDADTLLQRVDIAMYVSKRTGGDPAIYDAQADQHSAARLTLITELRRAVEQQELVLHYQPVVSLRSGLVTGMEALVRWPHQQRGLVPPAEFIPIAERTGIIKPLTNWVLETALRQSTRWFRAEYLVTMSVNLSVRNLLDPELPKIVADLFDTTGADPHRLKLEVTESVIMADPTRAMHNLSRLRELGVRFSIDDFGTGYSSLAYLQRLAVDEVKIDKSFVIGLPGSSSSQAIVKTAAELGHNLGFEVVAEGVEDRRTWDTLAALGCDLAQGYFISKPMPAEQAQEWLKNSTMRFDPQQLAA